MRFQKWKICLGIALLTVGNSQESVFGQTSKPGQTAKQGVPRTGFSLQVSTANLLTVSLKAENAPLAGIASELSAKLQVPVHLSSSVAKSEVTTDFKTLLLEPALHLLAPAVYIDYEINSAPGQPPRAVGIYLGSYADPPPPINAVVSNTSQVLMFAGHTEEGTDEASSAKSRTKSDEALQVSYEADALTVKAKQQLLTVVLATVANELGIPFDMRDQPNDLVDVDIKKLPLEDAISQLAPNVRLYVRADLQRVKRTPFRLVLVAPNKRT